MIYKNKNFSFEHFDKLIIENGDEFNSCNFSQAKETTTDKMGLKFINCNLLNFVAPIDAIVEGGLRINKSFCTHLHPNFPLPPCPVECQHVTGTDTITIDDIEIEKIYNYEDKVV